MTNGGNDAANKKKKRVNFDLEKNQVRGLEPLTAKKPKSDKEVSAVVAVMAKGMFLWSCLTDEQQTDP